MIRRHLEVIAFKTYADLRAERERTYLGLLWWIFEPLMYMLVFWLVFDRLLQRGGEGYVPFVLVGLVTWQWIKSCISHGGGAVREARPLIQQVVLPPAVFPIVVVLTDTVKFAAVLVLLLALLPVAGVAWTPALVALPAVLLVELLFICAATVWLAALVPFVPDLRLVAETLLTALMFVSGIFFRASQLPSEVQAVFFLNPAAFLIEQTRVVLLQGAWPDWQGLGILAVLSTVLLLLGIAALQRLRRHYPKLPA